MIIIKAQDIIKQYNLHPIIADLFIKRKLDTKWKIDNFLNSNLKDLNTPNTIYNIQEVKKQIFTHIEFDDLIYIFGDYDVDGVVSATILYKTLKQLGVNVKVLIGNRFKDGYGLSKRAIDIMKEAGLIITVDCGINDLKEINYAKSKGINVIVLDHHENNQEPDCTWVDLHLNTGNYPFKQLSAAGLVWKVCQYLLGKELYEYLDLVALSTIADLVPLYGENRVIVKHGLQKMQNTLNEGLSKLIKINNLSKITTGNVGYILAPCINAQGRLGDNFLSFELLNTSSVKKAHKISLQLKRINETRKEITKKALKDIEKQIHPKHNIIIAQGKYEPGIVGLIANEIVKKYEKPAIIFGKRNKKNICKGSGRSISPLHILDTCKEVNELFENLGGHKYAMGCSINYNNIDILKKKLNELTQGIKYKTIKYDLELSTDQINSKLLKDLKVFEPTGMGCPAPKFLIKGNITNITPISNRKHLKFKVDGIDCIAFNENKISRNSTIIGCLEINNWQNKKNIQVNIKKILNKE